MVSEEFNVQISSSALSSLLTGKRVGKHNGKADKDF